MIKVSDYVIQYLEQLGVPHMFMLPGGGAMHLNDSLGNMPSPCRAYCRPCRYTLSNTLVLPRRLPFLVVGVQLDVLRGHVVRRFGELLGKLQASSLSVISSRSSSGAFTYSRYPPDTSGVATDVAALLEEDDLLRAEARRRERGRHARPAGAHDNDVALELDRLGRGGRLLVVARQRVGVTTGLLDAVGGGDDDRAAREGRARD